MTKSEIHSIDPDYDCGDTDNKFENLPQKLKEWYKAQDAFYESIGGDNLTEEESDRIMKKWNEQWNATHDWA